MVSINLCDGAFKAPHEFDHLPLVWFRFSQPLPAEALLPEPVDLSKLYSTPRALSVSLETTALFHRSKRTLAAILEEKKDGELKLIKELLRAGSRCQREVMHFY